VKTETRFVSLAGAVLSLCLTASASEIHSAIAPGLFRHLAGK
jgi:hypothetical protein